MVVARLHALPEELLLAICAHRRLGARDVGSLRSTCQKLARVGADRRVWRGLVRRTWTRRVERVGSLRRVELGRCGVSWAWAFGAWRRALAAIDACFAVWQNGHERYTSFRLMGARGVTADGERGGTAGCYAIDYDAHYYNMPVYENGRGRAIAPGADARLRVRATHESVDIEQARGTWLVKCEARAVGPADSMTNTATMLPHVLPLGSGRLTVWVAVVPGGRMVPVVRDWRIRAYDAGLDDDNKAVSVFGRAAKCQQNIATRRADS